LIASWPLPPLKGQDLELHAGFLSSAHSLGFLRSRLFNDIAVVSLQGWIVEKFRPKSLGQRGEDAAARHLRRLGYHILARHCRSRLGELDLVAADGRTVVFVEVKTRRSTDAGHPADAVDEAKQRRLTRAALAYLKAQRLLNYAARFDVVAVTWPAGSRRPTIEHYQNAFSPPGRGQFFS
jgi:putative endonuclease